MPETVHSDWGEWLPRAIDDASPEGVTLWYLGCNGVALKTAADTTVFIDPYLGTGDPPRTVRMIPVPFAPADVRSADAVLATHEHTDHVHGPSQAPILAGTGATFFGSEASVGVTREAGWTDTWDVGAEQIRTVTPGETVSVGDVTVHIEPAHDPDAEGPLSFVIEHAAGTVFHGGDTKPDAVLETIGEDYDIDLGALAFGAVGMIPDKATGTPARTRWYADENDVVAAASALELDRLLPTHWDMWKGMTADPTALHHHVRSFEHPRCLEIAEIGDRVAL